MSKTQKPLFNFSITQSIHFEPILADQLKAMIIERIAQEQPDVVVTDVTFVNKRSTGTQAEVVGHLKGSARNDIKADSDTDLSDIVDDTPEQVDLVETIEEATKEEEAVEAPAVSSLLNKINLGTEEPKTVSSLFDK